MGSSSSESPSPESASFISQAQSSSLGNSDLARLALVCVKLPGAILRCYHTWAAWEGLCGLPCLPFVALQLLAVCHSGDKIPGRSTWGFPATNKHPWTPGGSEGARGLLSVPYHSPVVSIVLACPPDRPPEDRFDPRRRMDKLCTARVYMPDKEFTVRHGRARESAASPASPDDAPHAVSASNSAQSAPPARAAARPSLSTCKAMGEVTSTGCWRDAECRRRLFLLSIKPPTPTPTYVDVY
jgi:hypothetical protein